jgi:Protein of unknown function (DUF2975)
MKTKTMLVVLQILAFLGGIGYSIQCGSQILSLVASFINPDWAKRVYDAHVELFMLRQQSISAYVFAESIVIIILATKALIWYQLANLLLKLKIEAPFSLRVASKLETVSYLLVGIWGLSFVGKIFMDWLLKTMATPITDISMGDESFFIAGIAYVFSQIFRRGVEIQEENQLTV